MNDSVMNREMTAVVAYGPRDFRLTTRPIPQIGRGEVLMKVAACGICGSDVHAFHGAASYWGDAKTPAWMKAPVTPGHEFSGVVADLDAEAADKWGLSRGDRIVVEQILPCRKCLYCREGDYHLCEVHNMYGFQGGVADGGWAEYCRLGTNSLIHKVPEGLDLITAALAEPLACAVHAFNTGGCRVSDVAVVAGMGTIGGFIAQLVRLANPKCLIVVDVMDNRLELAKKYGADVVLNPKRDDVVARVGELGGGYGCDLYYDVTGHPSGVLQGLAMLRKKGRFVEFSVFGEETTADWSVIGEKKEMQIRGAHISPHTYPFALDLLASGRVTAEGLVTGRFPLREFERALETAQDASVSIKNLLIP